MRIVLLANHLNVGGISSYVITLGRGLVSRGHQVFVATSGGSLVSKLQKSGIRCVSLNVRMKSEINPFLFGNIPRLLALLKAENIDLMHAQTRVTAMLAASSSIFCGVPYMTTCHGYFKPHWGRRLVPLWGRRVIAISRPVVDHLTRDMEVRPEKIVLVPNGIDLNAFRPLSDAERQALRDRWGLGREPVVGIVARLSDVKGHAFLIDAVAQVRKVFPDVKCLIFGDGPLETELKQRVQTLGLKDAVLFYPVINRTSEVLGLLDVFVMPSLSEGLGLSAMEAMASGLPTVASGVGGLLDLIQDGVTGRLVPPKDPTALALVIQDVLADRVRARDMGEKARFFIATNYSQEKMLDGTLGVYRTVLGQNASDVS
ncbi:MAG: glycosyltransferase family 4 protein [Candidatus Omnitrophica bacterium]|nr:glycosyltransferase family 4 protein [Candidatus Omnitrophota bacterium]